MTDRSVVHGTIEFEHRFKASPARVFAAWTTKEALLRWGSPDADWVVSYDSFDFRLGGVDVSRFGPPGGGDSGTEVYISTSRYEDIVPDRRLVLATQMTTGMTTGGKRMFVGTVTVELYADGKGCRMNFTEQGAYLDGLDKPENHEAGWADMLQNLKAEVER